LPGKSDPKSGKNLAKEGKPRERNELEEGNSEEAGGGRSRQEVSPRGRTFLQWSLRSGKADSGGGELSGKAVDNLLDVLLRRGGKSSWSGALSDLRDGGPDSCS